MIVVAWVLLETEHVGGTGKEIAHVVVHPGGSGCVVDAAARCRRPAAPAHLVECETDRPAFEGRPRCRHSPALRPASTRAGSSGSALSAAAVLWCRGRFGGSSREASGYNPLPFLLCVVERERLLFAGGSAAVLLCYGVEKTCH